MSATVTPSTPTSPPGTTWSGRSVSRETLRPILGAMAIFVGIAAVGLCTALMTGATGVFNVLVFALFTVLWIAFAVALALSPGTLSDLWHQMRQLPLVIQGLVWLLFLPIVLGLWIWERNWSLPIRLILIIGLGVANIFMFVPRSL
jgi:hypothetical protein